MADLFYTDETNTLILISLLKAHNIKKIIASPGTTNISFVGSVQHDDFFEVFSAVDERSAAYMACGLAEESDEPVVLSCTGATASRNYLPGLTEAFYRHLPVLAVTSTQHTGRVGNYVAQVIDRSVVFNDLVKKSSQIPIINSEEDRKAAVTEINDALLELIHHESGPVHINLTTSYSNSFTNKDLPEERVINRIIDDGFPDLPIGRIGIFVGAHAPFSEEETALIDDFCKKYNAVVICDQISNYRGHYRFLASLVNSQQKKFDTYYFDLIIYIGSIHGAYLSFKGNSLWRVNRDGEIRDPYYNLTYVFEMEEKEFFQYYVKCKTNNNTNNNTILKNVLNARKLLLGQMPELPFSNLWIAKETANAIPEQSIVHFGILNSLRAWNYFETPEGVSCYSNTGGYGIDGGLSSFIGSALSKPDSNHYLIIGDLSFFYDINSLFNKLTHNIHIMLINNGVGVEFKNYNHRAAQFGDNADNYIAAKGHNGFKNPILVKKLCEDLNIKYMKAENKNEYKNSRDEWLKTSDGPVLIEIFTNDVDESKSLEMINSISHDSFFKSHLRKSIVWRAAKKILRR